MFETLAMAPADPILGLSAAFKRDVNPDKINLGVGVYKDASGSTPILESVREAEGRVVAEQTSKEYQPIPGDPRYGQLIQELLFGGDHEIVASGRARTAHTPGGTGALRVAGDYLHRMHSEATLWLSDPTWANHKGIFAAAGVPTKAYPYFDQSANRLVVEQMLAKLADVPAGDVVLLHGACHNPTGADPSAADWARIADVLAERSVLPLVDFAYQGFAVGLEEDAAGLRSLCRPDCELIVCSSYSKNFGLYRDRVGALTVVAADADTAERALSHVNVCIRTNYSNPAAHGGAIVATILDDLELRARWEQEVAEMRARINDMRALFVETLAAKGVAGDYSFIRRQKGMFSFSGLTRDQVDALRQKHAIYIVGSGRINVAGMTESNMDRLCTAIAGVL